MSLPGLGGKGYVILAMNARSYNRTLACFRSRCHGSFSGQAGVHTELGSEKNR